MITDERLEEIERRHQASSPGPYRRGIGSDSRRIFDANECVVAGDCAQMTGLFFAEAWRDVPDLIAEIRRLREKREEGT